MGTFNYMGNSNPRYVPDKDIFYIEGPATKDDAIALIKSHKPDAKVLWIVATTYGWEFQLA